MEIVTDYIPNHFTSKNGVDMVEGIKYNWMHVKDTWRNKGDEYYLIIRSEWDPMGGVSFTYSPLTRLFSVDGRPFKVKDFIEAEQMVTKYLRGSNSELPPLYQKES